MHITIKALLIASITLVFHTCNGQIKKDIKDSSKLVDQSIIQLDLKANLIFHDQKNRYWFISREKGIYQYDGKNLMLLTAEDGLLSDQIISVQEDKQGHLYFDTPEGVFVYTGQSFTTLESITGEATKGQWILEEDDLWFSMGWDKKGPYRFDGEQLYQLEFPKNEMEDGFYAKYPNVAHSPYGIYTIFKDSQGHLWFGTADLGIYHFDGQTISWMYEQQLTETEGGGAFGIRSIAEDPTGYFWICNTHFKYKVLPSISKQEGLAPLHYERTTGFKFDKTPYFLSMTTDNDGNIWMVTYDSGVWRNDGQTLQHYPIKQGEKEILLNSIYKDQHGVLWLATVDYGAYKYNGENFEKYILK